MESFDFPHLVVEKILRIRSLPTKVVVQTCLLSKQWEDLPSSLSTFDFNEHDDFQRHDSELVSKQHHKHLHNKFIEFLEGFLAFHVKHKQKDSCLEKLSLHTRMFSVHDDRERIVITNWLEYACQSSIGLKELDICLDHYIEPDLTVTEHMIETERPPKHKIYYDFYHLRLLLVSRCGQSLTSLKLECVQLFELWREKFHQPRLFPSLKILSLKTIRFSTYYSPYILLRECPSLEHLSLAYCSFKSSKLYVFSSNLKSLEVKYCEVDDIRVNKAVKLESFSFVSARDSECKAMILNSAFNLRHINVSVDRKIGVFSILGCHRALEASIKSQNIYEFELFDGYLSSKFSFQVNRVDHATILVEELMDQIGLMPSDPTYFHTLVSFIKTFRCCKNVSLYCETFEALIVPKPYRRMISKASPLRETSTLKVRMPCLLQRYETTHRYDELIETLSWMAPSAEPWERIISAIVDKERNKVEQRARSLTELIVL